LCAFVCSSPVIKNKLLDSPPPTGFFLSILLCTQPPHWLSSTRGISQIWLQVREESKKKFKNPDIIWQPAAGIYLFRHGDLFIFKFFQICPLGLIFFTKELSMSSSALNFIFIFFVTE
jgi:hypothetical protein